MNIWPNYMEPKLSHRYAALMMVSKDDGGTNNLPHLEYIPFFWKYASKEEVIETLIVFIFQKTLKQKKPKFIVSILKNVLSDIECMCLYQIWTKSIGCLWALGIVFFFRMTILLGYAVVLWFVELWLSMKENIELEEFSLGLAPPTVGLDCTYWTRDGDEVWYTLTNFVECDNNQFWHCLAFHHFLESHSLNGI